MDFLADLHEPVAGAWISWRISASREPAHGFPGGSPRIGGRRVDLRADLREPGTGAWISWRIAANWRPARGFPGGSPQAGNRRMDFLADRRELAAGARGRGRRWPISGAAERGAHRLDGLLPRETMPRTERRSV